MTGPDGVTADIPGLRGLSRDLFRIADDIAAVGAVTDRVPAPTVSTYGWQPTADAMTHALSSWSAEVDLLRRVCGSLARAAQHSADRLQETEDRLAGRFDHLPARPV